MDNFLPQETILRKRDGLILADAEISAFIRGLTSGEVGEGQAAALAMATYFKGMTSDETVALTLAMRDSGKTLSWENLDGPVLDKHSTGGIGDKVSLILAPLVAAAGGYVPMISGRGLGHTGGTLDKLESIPGYTTRIPLDRFQTIVRETGCAIVGPTGEIAPADGRLYAIRDVTATVDIPPMIVASILSKKLAAGLDGLVMDIKAGSGAFMTSIEEARTLGSNLVQVARGAGLPCRAVLTDMNQCLGRQAGNSLEVLEAIDMLRGHGVDPRLETVTLTLASELLLLGRLARTADEASQKIRHALDDGSAAERFAKMVRGLGGPSDLLDRPERYLPKAKLQQPVFLKGEGRIVRIDTKALGMAVIELGGGRRRPEDGIDHRAGLQNIQQIGEMVGSEQPFAYVHAADEATADCAIRRIQAAVELGDAGTSNMISPVIERIS